MLSLVLFLVGLTIVVKVSARLAGSGQPRTAYAGTELPPDAAEDDLGTRPCLPAEQVADDVVRGAYDPASIYYPVFHNH